MKIPVNTEEKEFFNNYILCLAPLLKLKKREREVLSTLLLVYYANRKKGSPEAINKFLFMTKVKKQIREHLKPEMSEASYNNHLVQLRVKKVLSNDNKLNSALVENSMKDFEQFRKKGLVSISYEFKKIEP